MRRAKDHLKGSLMLSLESTSSRMSNLARQEMHFRRFFSLDELAESIETGDRGGRAARRADFLRSEECRADRAGQSGRIQDRPRRSGLLEITFTSRNNGICTLQNRSLLGVSELLHKMQNPATGGAANRAEEDPLSFVLIFLLI